MVANKWLDSPAGKGSRSVESRKLGKKVKHQCLEKRKMLDCGKRSDDWRFKERER
jgi:hypothetical protein